MIITIDGPAGTGKSTVAKRVAEALDFVYFDTGAMYRGVTYLMLKNGIPLDDTKKIEEILKNFTFEITKDKRYFVNKVDVSKEIRSQEVNAFVSQVAALPFVRKSLGPIQKEFGKHANAVFEGRDLGTVIFPHAEIKIFLTASPEIRATRRLNETHYEITYEKLLADIIQRDHMDSTREISPLRCPEGALQIDTSDLTIDQVVEKILNYKHTKFP